MFFNIELKFEKIGINSNELHIFKKMDQSEKFEF